MNTVVALHAHPDDESSKGAGTVARLSDSGYRSVLVCATGGEAGDILNPALDRPEIRDRLAEVRREELGRATAIIGYDEVISLGYRDSGMRGVLDNELADAFVNAPTFDVLGRVVEIVRRERPNLVLGYDSHERYPHPDHLKVHEITVLLPAAAADPDRYSGAGEPWQIPVVAAPAFTLRRAVTLHEEMLRRRLDTPHQARLDWFAGHEDDATRLASVDVGGFIERCRDALREHATQTDPDGFWFQVPTEVVEEVYPFEDFEVIHAADGALEGVGIFEEWAPRAQD